MGGFPMEEGSTFWKRLMYGLVFFPQRARLLHTLWVSESVPPMVTFKDALWTILPRTSFCIQFVEHKAFPYVSVVGHLPMFW